MDSQTCIYELGVDFDRKRAQAVSFPPPIFTYTRKEKAVIVLNEEMLVLCGGVYFCSTSCEVLEEGRELFL